MSVHSSLDGTGMVAGKDPARPTLHILNVLVLDGNKLVLATHVLNGVLGDSVLDQC